jgi:hypothetical protein
MLKKKLYLFLLALTTFLKGGLVNKVFAQEPPCINTALGCIPPDIDKFAPWFLQIIFGIAGGIAFLLMVYGFILMATSSGDEKKLQGAKETVTSAITGLLVSIFALFLFRLVAVDILKIPGIN